MKDIFLGITLILLLSYLLLKNRRYKLLFRIAKWCLKIVVSSVIGTILFCPIGTIVFSIMMGENPFSLLISLISSKDAIGFIIWIFLLNTCIFFAINVAMIIFNRRGKSLSFIKILMGSCLFGIFPGGLYFIIGSTENYFHPIEKYGLFLLITWVILIIGVLLGFLDGCVYYMWLKVKLNKKGV